MTSLSITRILALSFAFVVAAGLPAYSKSGGATLHFSLPEYTYPRTTQPPPEPDVPVSGRLSESQTVTHLAAIDFKDARLAHARIEFNVRFEISVLMDEPVVNCAATWSIRNPELAIRDSDRPNAKTLEVVRLTPEQIDDMEIHDLVVSMDLAVANSLDHPARVYCDAGVVGHAGRKPYNVAGSPNWAAFACTGLYNDTVRCGRSGAGVAFASRGEARRLLKLAFERPGKGTIKIHDFKARLSPEARAIVTARQARERAEVKARLDKLNEEAARYAKGGASGKQIAQAVDIYRKAADQGSDTAQYELARLYQNGRGVRQDYAAATKLYRRAADQGHASAQASLGYIYEFGLGMKTSDKRAAANWYEKAARQGNSVAQFNLGLLYSKGSGVERNDTVAAQWFRKSAEQGDRPAQYNLGEAYDLGRGVPRDHAAAFRWYKASAEGGYARGEYGLGRAYRYGIGVDKDLGTARRWLLKAAASGSAEAQLALGMMSFDGEGVPRDRAEAVRWFEKAAQQGNRQAQVNFGVCYLNGDGVAKDYAKALQWFNRAYFLGDVTQAGSHLANMYANGYGVEANQRTATNYYRKAAEKGYALAQYNLANRYRDGVGVQQDFAMARMWFLRAAAQGDPYAQHNLGMMYKQGFGGRDDRQAEYWLSRARAKLGR